MDKRLEVAGKDLAELEHHTLRKARKCIGAYLVRNSNSKVEATFKLWKHHAIRVSQRQKLAIKVIEHWRKYQFLHVRNCFKTWISAEKTQMKRNLIKQTMIHQEEQEQYLKHNEEVMEQTRKQAKSSMVRSIKKQNFKKTRINKAV